MFLLAKHFEFCPLVEFAKGRKANGKKSQIAQHLRDVEGDACKVHCNKSLAKVVEVEKESATLNKAHAGIHSTGEQAKQYRHRNCQSCCKHNLCQLAQLDFGK